MPCHISLGLMPRVKTGVFSVVNGHGVEVKTQRVNTSECELLEFVCSLGKETHLTFEESSLSQWLFGLFEGKVRELIVCNSQYIAKRRGAKDDHPDAYHLAQQLRGSFLTPVFHKKHFLFSLRQLVSAYQSLVKDQTRLKIRFKFLFVSQGTRKPGNKAYNHEEHIEDLEGAFSKFIARDYFGRIQSMEKMRKEYLSIFEKYGRKIPEIKAIKSLPGMGPVRSCVIASRIVCANRFQTKHKFWAYCDLVKHESRSDGILYGKKKIHGNRFLKDCFMGAAQRTLETKQEVIAYYQQMLALGFSHKAVKNNIARTLAAISLAVMRTKKKYDPKIWEEKLKASQKRLDTQ